MEQKEWTRRFLKSALFVPPLIMLFLGMSSAALLSAYRNWLSPMLPLTQLKIRRKAHS